MPSRNLGTLLKDEGLCLNTPLCHEHRGPSGKVVENTRLFYHRNVERSFGMAFLQWFNNKRFLPSLILTPSWSQQELAAIVARDLLDWRCFPVVERWCGIQNALTKWSQLISGRLKTRAVAGTAESGKRPNGAIIGKFTGYSCFC